MRRASSMRDAIVSMPPLMIAHEVKMNVAPITAAGISVKNRIRPGMNAITTKIAADRIGNDA